MSFTAGDRLGYGRRRRRHRRMRRRQRFGRVLRWRWSDVSGSIGDVCLCKKSSKKLAAVVGIVVPTLHHCSPIVPPAVAARLVTHSQFRGLRAAWQKGEGRKNGVCVDAGLLLQLRMKMIPMMMVLLLLMKMTMMTIMIKMPMMMGKMQAMIDAVI